MERLSVVRVMHNTAISRAEHIDDVAYKQVVVREADKVGEFQDTEMSKRQSRISGEVPYLLQAAK